MQKETFSYEKNSGGGVEKSGLESTETQLAQLKGDLENSKDPRALFFERSKKRKEEQNNSKKSLAEYFYLKSFEIKIVQESISKAGLEGSLNITQFLVSYREYIEKKFNHVNYFFYKKLLASVGLRVLEISNIIEERIAFVDEQIEKGHYKKEDREKEIQNQKWIINKELQENFSFLDNKLFPTLEFSLVGSPEDKIKIGQLNTSYYIEELEEIFGANLDKKGNFIEKDFGLYNQTLMTMESPVHKEVFNKYGITKKEEISLLNEKDKKIEAEAIKYFMIAMALQISIEVGPAAIGSVFPLIGTAFGTLIGAGIGGGIDVADVFSDTEILLQLVQKAGLVDPNYRMNKTWIDNVLAGIGILPGMTPLLKGEKVAKALSKIPESELADAYKKMNVLRSGSQLNDSEMLREAIKILNRELTHSEKYAIVMAHNIKSWGIQKYTKKQLQEKIKILKEAGFSPEEYEALLKRGI